MKVERLLYPDICKFVAIFIVTWSHCAQRISGMIWTNFWGGNQLDIAFTMPLFMLMSGWFVNLDKMRDIPLKEYIISKFKRLIIPSFVWYFVVLILSFNLPDLSLFTYYWYLTALFVCLCVIMISCKIIKSNPICAIVTNLIVLLIPYSDYAHINFMMPFLWAGYGLRRIVCMKYAHHFIFLCSIIAVYLCSKWDSYYSVYTSPFNSININIEMVQIMSFRFIIGFTLSAVIIYSIMKFEKSWISKLSKYGYYSLVIYTSSLAILSFLARVFNCLHIHTNMYLFVDIVSFILCAIIVIVAIVFANFCKKKEILSCLFLGE